MTTFKVVVKNGGKLWSVDIKGPIDSDLKEYLKYTQNDLVMWSRTWEGYLYAPNVKMAMARLLNLIPDLQE